MKKYEKLSFCGLFCGGCKNYKENFNCMGCRNEKELVNDCPSRSCCINKGLLHCGECSDFSCNILNDFYNNDVPHHQLAYKNMIMIKDIGVEKWLSQQEEAHTCICGRKKKWFDIKCTAQRCQSEN